MKGKKGCCKVAIKKQGLCATVKKHNKRSSKLLENSTLEHRGGTRTGLILKEGIPGLLCLPPEAKERRQLFEMDFSFRGCNEDMNNIRTFRE